MRPIDADELINQKPFTAVAGSIGDYVDGYLDCAEAAREAIQNAPTIDPEDLRPQGEWDEIPNTYMSVASKDGTYSGKATSCSVCHEINPNAYKTNYCPNCGARMKGAGEDD